MSGHPREVLADAARRLAHSVRAFDGSDDDARDAIAVIEAALELVEPHRQPGPFMQSGLEAAVDLERFESGDPMLIFPYSPVVGRRNPFAPPVEMWAEHGETYGRVVLEPGYCGPPHSVHGGIVALVFDELLGSTSVVNMIGAPTGTLTVVYRSFTPQGQPLDLHGWIDRTEGRKIFIKGEIRHEGELCAEAEGIFIRPRGMWGVDPDPVGGR